MKFTCSTSTLNDSLQVVTRALASRSINSVLEGLLIETSDDSIILTCTDEQITITTRMEALVNEHGRALIPGKLFTEIVRRLPEGDVIISSDEQMVVNIRSEYSKAKLSGFDPDLFPTIPHVNGEYEVVVPQSLLKDMIQKTEFCIAQEDVRQALTGALLEISGGDIIMVGLDGYRLAWRRAPFGDILERCSAIVPGRALSEIAKLLSNDEESMVTLYMGGNKLHINLGETDIYVVLVEGEYVKYRQIIPNSFSTRIVVKLEELRSCVDRAALIAREGKTNLILFRINDERLFVEAHSEIGDVVEELKIEQMGNDLNIAFFVKYISDVVRYMDGERIEMCFNSPIKPCVVNPLDMQEDYMLLVLPIRTGATSSSNG